MGRIAKGSAYATSAKVGDEDPRGSGFRVWFRSRNVDAQKLAAKVDMPQARQADKDEI
jgi:hypothetical protein